MPKNLAAIVITAPSIHTDAIAVLNGFRLIFCRSDAAEAELAQICANARPVALMVRYGDVSARVIESAGPQLRVIAKHGVGIDNIDSVFAASKGIPVVAALGSNSQAVAEHAICLLMACARRIVWLDGRMRQGHWDKDSYDGIELHGGKLGLIGFGAIGTRVARIAHAIGMQVSVYDPFADESTFPTHVQLMALDDLLESSDAVSLHCPLNEETRHIINATRLATMKPGAIIINTARAGLIDEPALLEALHASRIVAGLDCFAQEPVQSSNPLALAPHVVLTPHIGGTTDAAYREMGTRAAHNILKALGDVNDA